MIRARSWMHDGVTWVTTTRVASMNCLCIDIVSIKVWKRGFELEEMGDESILYLTPRSPRSLKREREREKTGM